MNWSLRSASQCSEPVKLRGLRIGRFFVRRVAQGWLCFKCEEGATQDSVGVRRQLYLTAAYPNGPRSEPVSHHKQLRSKFMPWVPVAAPEDYVQ
jgi:hypothetical protein